VGAKSTSVAELLEVNPGSLMERAFPAAEEDSVAKILFTSGSTGLPKGVINTHRMLCANQQMILQAWPFLEEKPPVVVDWLPWNHTFGANHNFNMVLRNGGTIYVDGGKPVPGLVEQTVANLREISPTLYFNVPRGFDLLLPYLEKDEALRENFFRNLDVLFFAAAALPRTSGTGSGSSSPILRCCRRGDRPKPRRSPPRCTFRSTAPASSAFRSRAAS
jgi:feruloyl-CoA synthase